MLKVFAQIKKSLIKTKYLLLTNIFLFKTLNIKTNK